MAGMSFLSIFYGYLILAWYVITSRFPLASLTDDCFLSVFSDTLPSRILRLGYQTTYKIFLSRCSVASICGRLQ